MTSRYPDLNEKALMGGDIGIAALGSFRNLGERLDVARERFLALGDFDGLACVVDFSRHHELHRIGETGLVNLQGQRGWVVGAVGGRYRHIEALGAHRILMIRAAAAPR